MVQSCGPPDRYMLFEEGEWQPRFALNASHKPSDLHAMELAGPGSGIEHICTGKPSWKAE